MKKEKSILEQFLLVICLCVLALRATNSESINLSSVSPWIHIGENLASLVFTSVLFTCVILWLIRAFFSKTFTYSFTAFELPLLLFIIAGAVGITIASQKRAAVNDFVTMVVPILTAIMLVQILNSESRIHFVLAVIVALGCASAYRCIGQFFTEANMMIEQYEAAPESMLNSLGLTKGTFEAWMFEHRLYTKGINGFLTTSNSVASFAMLAVFAAIGLFAERIKLLIEKKGRWICVIMTGCVLTAVLLNFLFVRSKGGTAGFLLAFILFIFLLRFGRFVKKHRIKLLIIVLLLVVVSTAVIINYGLERGRLPGGNSMLVRWQYWTATAKMYNDHRLTGVGPGNFNSYYPQYKAPAALETVKDPHNFILSILSQYGPLGLIAFLGLLLIPLWRILKPTTKTESRLSPEPLPNLRTIIAYIIVIAAALLIIRPILNPATIRNEPLVVVVYAVFSLYISPVIIFVLAFFLTLALSHRFGIRFTGITVNALLCGCIGLCLHNMIDFAIFEPGIYTTLWITLACLVALDRLKRDRPQAVYIISTPAKIAASTLTIFMGLAYFYFVVLPVGQSTSLLRKAGNDYEYGFLDNVQVLLKRAAQKDPLSPNPLLASGNLYLQYLDYYGPRQKEILIFAEKVYINAAKRNPADFRPYEKLAMVYNLLAERTSGKTKECNLNKSLDSARRTVELYPGLARLRLDLAEAAERLGRYDLALEEYKKAVEIEDAYREQFKIMYPTHELFSRLGQEQYEYAQKRIAELRH